jgi:hypothetical protein
MSALSMLQPSVPSILSIAAADGGENGSVASDIQKRILVARIVPQALQLDVRSCRGPPARLSRDGQGSGQVSRSSSASTTSTLA